MPYQSLGELPDSVKDNLPKHGQEIYKEAYNNAWEQYADPAKRRSDESREEVSHKISWAAVKNKYEKKGDRWVRKKE